MITYTRRRRASTPAAAPPKPRPRPTAAVETPPAQRPRVQTYLVLDGGGSGTAADLAARVCPQCGMAYAPGTEDERVHEQYHRRATAPVRSALLLRDCEVVARDAPSGTAVVRVPAACLGPRAPTTGVARAVRAVLRAVDRALGSPEAETEEEEEEREEEREEGAPSRPALVLLCVHEQTGTVHGAVVAHAIRAARAVDAADGTVCCGGPARRATAGIAKIFVHAPQRRRGVATRLLDAVRATLVYGRVVPRAELAATQPTRDGAALFARYAGTPHFLVYDPAHADADPDDAPDADPLPEPH